MLCDIAKVMFYETAKAIASVHDMSVHQKGAIAILLKLMPDFVEISQRQRFRLALGQRLVRSHQ